MQKVCPGAARKVWKMAEWISRVIQFFAGGKRHHS